MAWLQDTAEAAALALEAGIDIDMASEAYLQRTAGRRWSAV